MSPLDACSGSHPAKVRSILDLIGATPLLRIRRIAQGLAPDVSVYAKVEGFNPGGSIKDRPALWMVRKGLKEGKLVAGKTIIDSTSGNTGIALAMIGAVLGYPVELVMPDNVSVERKRVVHAFGAKLIPSSAMEGSDGAIELCRRIIAANPDKYFKPDQYFNPANPMAHYESTGPEIWRQTQGTVTHFVAGIGTGGTVMGVGRYLKEKNPAVEVIAVEPDSPLHGLEGLKHMASSIVPGIFNENELDEKIKVASGDAYDMVYRIGLAEGLVVGQSSGAALWAALRVASRLKEGVVVTVFPDFGDRYLSTNLWTGWKKHFGRRE